VYADDVPDGRVLLLFPCETDSYSGYSGSLLCMGRVTFFFQFYTS
jgi:hypothetical protein